MPSSGYGATQIVPMPDDTSDRVQCTVYETTREHIVNSARHAMKHGLFVEWLESFLAAWEQTHDAHTAANAGIIEWDL